MPTDKPQTSQSDLISVRKRMDYLPNPLNPIRTVLDLATGTFIKGVWNGIWSFVTNPQVDYGPGSGGSSIRESKDATQRMVDQMRQRRTQ